MPSTITEEYCPITEEVISEPGLTKDKMISALVKLSRKFERELMDIKNKRNEQIQINAV
jgi:hypothetical protein